MCINDNTVYKIMRNLKDKKNFHVLEELCKDTTVAYTL